MSAGHHVVWSDLRRPWLVANFLAFGLGGGLAGGMLRFLQQPYYESGVSAIEAGYIQASSLGVSAAIFGALVGTAQWLVLRRTLRAGWWAPATCLGWGLSGVVMGFNAGGSVSSIGPDAGPVPPLLALVVIPPLLVVLLGSVQWLLLRREFDGARWWPLINVAGLIAGLFMGFVAAKSVPWLAPTDFPSAQALGLVGAVAGPLYGAVTWPLLTQLRRREPLSPARAEPARPLA
jgi:hypothetical protein